MQNVSYIQNIYYLDYDDIQRTKNTIIFTFSNKIIANYGMMRRDKTSIIHIAYTIYHYFNTTLMMMIEKN